jgi:hypothetical protein
MGHQVMIGGIPVRVRQLGRTPQPAHVIEDHGETVKVRFDVSGKTRVVARGRLVFDEIPSALAQLPTLPIFDSTNSRAIPKNPPQRDAIYLAYVRSMACCICGAPSPSDPHHFGPGGMGLKADDRRTVPLCRRCHDLWHLQGTIEPYTRGEVERFFYRAQVDALIGYDRRE